MIAQTPVPVPLRTPADALQSRSVYRYSKDSAPYRDFIRSALESTPTLGSPSDSWTHVGGTGQDSNAPSSPASARRRAASVPSRPPKMIPTSSPMPSAPIALPSPNDSHSILEISLPAHRLKTSEEPRIRPSRGVHGVKSASLSVPTPHNSLVDEKSGPRSSNAQERQPPRHTKQTSMGVSEGFRHTVDLGPSSRMGLKSAMKHRVADRPAQSRHMSDSGHAGRPVPSTWSMVGRHAPAPSSLPISASEGSLKPSAWRPLDIENARGRRTVAKSEVKLALASESTISTHNKLDDTREEPNEEACRVPEQPADTLKKNGSFGSILRGHGLASDSRVLPVLDNIWGSFISETAFGSLPSSPVNLNGTKRRVENSIQGFGARGQVNMASGSPDHQRFLSDECAKPDLAPSTCPPVTGLPPAPPNPPQVLDVSPGNVPQRKRSSPCMLLMPPISPEQERELRGLAFALNLSASEGTLEGGEHQEHAPRSTGFRPGVSRLARSVSSPVVRSPIIPSSSFVPEPVRDTSMRPSLSVNLPHTRSISPSTSLSSSQCTPVPGTPVASPFSATTSVSSYLGESSGSPLTATTSVVAVPYDRDAHVKVQDQSSKNREPTVRALSPVSVFMGGSELSLSMFPPVPPDRTGVQVEERDGAAGERVPGTGLHQKSLPTPPMTPAWFAQMFNMPSVDDQEMFDER